MKKIKDYILFFIALFILYFIIKFFYNKNERIVYKDKVITKTEYVEVIKKDTVTRYKEKKIIRFDTITVKDTVLVYIPIESKVFENTVDSTLYYKAYVSGYNANLDSIFFKMNYPKVKEIQYIKEPQTWLQKHFYYGVGIGAGYGVIHKNFDMYVGGNIGFKF